MDDNFNVYMDCSMMGGLDDDIAALGRSMVVMKDQVVRAIARGVVPDYVRSVLASEMWALAMATLYFGAPTAMFFTDCKAVRHIARSGERTATSASQLHARIWAIVFNHTMGQYRGSN